MNSNWKQANLWVSRFLASLQMGIASSANPYVDEFIETLDCGLMTTAKMMEALTATRAMLVTGKDMSAVIPTFLYLLLCGDSRNDTFLKLTTGKGAAHWATAFRKSYVKCGAAC